MNSLAYWSMNILWQRGEIQMFVSSVKNSPACNLNGVFMIACLCLWACLWLGQICLCAFSLCVCARSGWVRVCARQISPGWRAAPWLLLPGQQRCRQAREDSATPTQLCNTHTHTHTHTELRTGDYFSPLSLSAPALNVIVPLNLCYQLLSAWERWVSRVLLHLLVGSVVIIYWLGESLRRGPKLIQIHCRLISDCETALLTAGKRINDLWKRIKLQLFLSIT